MQDEIKRLQDEKRVAEWFREIQTITGSKRKFNTQSLESVFQSYSKIQQAVIIAISGRTVEQAIAEGLWVVETGI